MTAMHAAQTMTAAEFLALPVPERGRPWNLVEGEVVVNQPTPEHAGIQTRLIGSLWAWTQAGPGRGKVSVPLDLRIDDRSVYAPDVLWYSEGRAPNRQDPPPAPMPDLAAEVRSPSTWRYDIGAKKAGYERHGLRELWLVDTAADGVLVFRRSAPGAPVFDMALELDVRDALTSPLLPGFSLPLAELFAG